MTTAPTFGFVIPCFNEEDNVGATVGSVREAMGARDDYEIILVDDASTDRTLKRHGRNCRSCDREAGRRLRKPARRASGGYLVDTIVREEKVVADTPAVIAALDRTRIAQREEAVVLAPSVLQATGVNQFVAPSRPDRPKRQGRK